MSAKNYRDKKALPLVEKLKEVVKNLTIKCVQLTEQGRKLTAKVGEQKKQISRLTDKVMEQNDTIDRLQEKAVDLGRLERHFGREQVQSIVERSKALEHYNRHHRHSQHNQRPLLFLRGSAKFQVPLHGRFGAECRSNRAHRRLLDDFRDFRKILGLDTGVAAAKNPLVACISSKIPCCRLWRHGRGICILYRWKI